MKRIISLALAVGLLVSFAGFAAASSRNPQTIPTFRIVSVTPGQMVTIETANFPASQLFVVTMGKMGTRGVGGIQVSTTSSGDGGTITESYAIPPELKDEQLIAIRLESDEGFFSYNWFINQPASPAATSTPAPVAPVTGSQSSTFKIPTFEVIDVIPDQQVSIQTADFPAKQVFRVLMGRIGTRGVNGILVDQTNSGQGGSFQATYTIPPELIGQAQIAIRLESAEGFFSYNWFANQLDTANSVDTGSGPTPAPTAAGTAVAPVTGGTIPTISILSVSKDQDVTIQTANFPAGQSFKVTMGKFGTRGVGGVAGATVNSGSGGTFQVTLAIPAELAGMDPIAIRLESPQGFFAYNWFLNQ